MILVKRLRLHGTHSIARARNFKGYAIKRRSRLSSSRQFYVQDLLPFDQSLVLSKFACAMLAVFAA